MIVAGGHHHNVIIHPHSAATDDSGHSCIRRFMVALGGSRIATAVTMLRWICHGSGLRRGVASTFLV